MPGTTPTKVDASYPPYQYTPVVYDAGRQKLVLFGGQSYARALWELKVSDYTWINRSNPVSGPIQRQYPSIAFDSKTRRPSCSAATAPSTAPTSRTRTNGRGTAWP